MQQNKGEKHVEQGREATHTLDVTFRAGHGATLPATSNVFENYWFTFRGTPHGVWMVYLGSYAEPYYGTGEGGVFWVVLFHEVNT